MEQSNHFLNSAISNKIKLRRTFSLLAFIALLIAALIYFTVIIINKYFHKVDLAGFSFETANSTFKFKDNNSELEYLNLPANYFWMASSIQLDKNKKISICAKGMVATVVSPSDSVHLLFKETLKAKQDTKWFKLKANLIEYQRYYVSQWVDPDGTPLIKINPELGAVINPKVLHKPNENRSLKYYCNIDCSSIKDTALRKECRRIKDSLCVDTVYKISKEKNVLKSKDYGSLIGFVISNDYHPNVNDEIKFVDSMLVYRDSAYFNNYIKVFFIGSESSIIYDERSGLFLVKNKQDMITERIPGKFNGGRMYFIINDTVLPKEMEKNEFTPACCKPTHTDSTREKHYAFYQNISRPQLLWYLDNQGSFNIFVLSEKAE